MFRNKSVEAYSCGEPGDLYAWNATSWNNKQINSTKNITKQIKQLVCANKDVLILPRKSLSESLKYCSSITGGNLFQGAHEDFLEIIRQPTGLNEFWLPYTDGAELGSFINIYSNSSFNVSLFAYGEPNGGNNFNSLFWANYENGGNGGAKDASEDYKINSLCEHAKQPRSLKIRGLCSSSYIDKEYRAVMHPDRKTIVWIGTGLHKAIIQYSKESGGLILKSLNKILYAQINLRNSAELFGKNEWTIFNDIGCSAELSYTRNVSLRYMYLYTEIYD